MRVISSHMLLSLLLVSRSKCFIRSITNTCSLTLNKHTTKTHIYTKQTIRVNLLCKPTTSDYFYFTGFTLFKCRYNLISNSNAQHLKKIILCVFIYMSTEVAEVYFSLNKSTSDKERSNFNNDFVQFGSLTRPPGGHWPL